jgi:superfamily II DNA/RNA helicase
VAGKFCHPLSLTDSLLPSVFLISQLHSRLVTCQSVHIHDVCPEDERKGSRAAAVRIFCTEFQVPCHADLATKGKLMTFSELQLLPPILKAVQACGYDTPTPIQAEAIPAVLAGRDLIGIAQTGTGKTAGFVLPALQLLASPPKARGKGPRVLVLTPTRELANQVSDAVRSYGKFCRVRSGAILGGMAYREQLRLLSQPVDLIVATPGRLVDHLENGRLDLSRVEMLIIDEADRMLDMGFSDDMDKIAAATPEGRQTLMFTATMDNAMARLATSMLNDPERIEIAGKKVTHDTIEQRLHVADDMGHKNRLLQHLINDNELSRAIIFSATKRDAESLAQELFQQGHAAAALHGDMSQGARNRTIVNLRRGKIKLLVATDVAARGLDVNGISHVINFDLPRFAEDYVHRIGRTGRAGATGTAISFVSLNELSYLQRIERFIGQKLPRTVIEGLEPKRVLPTLPGGGSGRPGGPRRANGAPPAGGSRKKSFGNKQEQKPASDRRKPWGAPRQKRDVVVEYRQPVNN